MTRWQRFTTIFSLGLPIIGGMLSQSLLNLVDAAMVGALGETSLAGIGIGGYAIFIAISLILGLSSGVQAQIARRKGQDRDHEIAIPLIWGLLCALLITIPLTLLFLHSSEYIVALFSDDIQAIAIADSYFDYRILALLAIGLNLSVRGYWNGTNRPMVYLRVLLLTHILNAVLNYLLIYGHLGFEPMGAPGAGLGTTISLYFGAMLIGLLTLQDTARRKLNRFNLAERTALKSLLRLAIPHSIQQFFFAAAVAVLFWIIGLLGTEQQAIGHVLINLALLLILPGVGLGIASTTLVSHALGQQRPELACRWGWDVIVVATIIMATLSLPMWLAPEAILSLFLTTEQAIAEARLPLMLTGAAICLDAAAIVLTQALLGAGANRTVMIITTAGQWLFYLPLAWFVGPWLGFGLTGIWIIQIIHRSLSSLAFIYIWNKRSWVHIRI